MYVGFGIQFYTYIASTFCGFCKEAAHGYTGNPTHGVRIYLNTDGTISLKNNNSGANIATSTLAVSPTTWHYLEIKYVFGSGTSGSFQLKVNADGSAWSLAAINGVDAGIKVV